MLALKNTELETLTCKKLTIAELYAPNAVRHVP